MKNSVIAFSMTLTFVFSAVAAAPQRPNPASEFCDQIGGTVDINNNTCTIDEWALYNYFNSIKK